MMTLKQQIEKSIELELNNLMQINRNRFGAAKRSVTHYKLEIANERNNPDENSHDKINAAEYNIAMAEFQIEILEKEYAEYENQMQRRGY